MRASGCELLRGILELGDEAFDIRRRAWLLRTGHGCRADREQR